MERGMSGVTFNGPRTVHLGPTPEKMTPESFTRALEHHLARGNIKAWHRAPNGAWVITPWDHELIVIKTAKEAAYFAAGLASADKGRLRREAQAEA